MGRDELATKEIERLAEVYAARLARNTAYRVSDMPELKKHKGWNANTQAYRDAVAWYIRDKALKLLSAAGFPSDVLQRIREGK